MSGSLHIIDLDKDIQKNAPVDGYNPSDVNQKIYPDLAINRKFTTEDVGCKFIRVYPLERPCEWGFLALKETFFDWSFIPHKRTLTDRDVIIISQSESGLQGVKESDRLPVKYFEQYDDGNWALLEVLISNHCYTMLE